MKRNALLIGGSGQLGSELLRSASDQWCFTAPSHLDLDITNATAVSDAVEQIGPDLIINCSAFHIVDLCESRFSDALAVNAVAVSALAKVAQRAKARFVTVSSDYVFDGNKRTPYLETDAVGPIQNYGISKVAGELAALAAHEEGAIVIRSCGLYGLASSRQKGGNFVLNRLNDAQSKSEVEVGADLICTPTSTRDLAAGILTLLANDAPAGTYHLTNRGSCNWAEFTAEIFRAAGSLTRAIPVDRGGRYAPARRPAYSVLGCGKAEAFGAVMPSWQEALASFVAELSL